MRNAFLALAVIAGVTMAAAPARAHEDAGANPQKAANGGQLRVAGPYHLELVLAKDAVDGKESPLLVYVTDHGGKKVPTAGASGTATLLSGKLKASAVLKPDGENRLQGVANYVASADIKVVVAVTLPGKQPEQARFTPLAVAADGHTEHSH